MYMSSQIIIKTVVVYANQLSLSMTWSTIDAANCHILFLFLFLKRKQITKQMLKEEKLNSKKIQTY